MAWRTESLSGRPCSQPCECPVTAGPTVAAKENSRISNKTPLISQVSLPMTSTPAVAGFVYAVQSVLAITVMAVARSESIVAFTSL